MASPSCWDKRVWLFAAVTVLGCSGGDGGPGPAPSILVTVSPPTLQVLQGEVGTVNVSLSRGGGFSGAVTVSLSGVPTGVTATVTPTTLSGATSSATVSVNVRPTAVPGTYPITVRASATGVGEATAQYTLEVLALPNYTLTASPNAVTIPQGLTGTATVNIARTNFTGGVALSLDNPPAGITGSFNPASATGNSSVLTISVANTVATGNYNLTVKGAATGPGEKTTTVALTVTAQPTYTLSLTPNALTIAAGSNQTATVNIARTNFTGAVTLSLDSPPAGVTATFAPPAPTDNQSTMTLNIANTVAAGTYTITVKGTASGVPTVVDGEVQTVAPGDRTTTLQLTVIGSSGISLAVSPNQLSIQQGAQGQSTLTVTRTNFTGNVAPSATGQPSGMTVTFNPNPITANTSTITVAVAGSVAVGTYNLTITGSSTVGNPTTQLQVTVTGPTSGNMNWDFCDASTDPVWFGKKEEGGAWQQVMPTTVGNIKRYTFSINTPTGYVAFTTPASSSVQAAQGERLARMTTGRRGGASAERVARAASQARLGSAGRTSSRAAIVEYVTDLFYFGASEGAALGQGQCDPVGQTGSATISVTGMVPADYSWTAWRSAAVQLTSAMPSRNVMLEVGMGDAWSTRHSATTGEPFFSDMQRGKTVPGSISISANAMVPIAKANATITGVPNGAQIFDFMGLDNNNGPVGTIPGIFPGPQTTRPMFAHPSSISDDLYSYGLITSWSSGMTSDLYSQIHYLGNTVTPRTFPLNATVPAFMVSSLGTSPTYRVNTTGSIPSEYNGGFLAIEHAANASAGVGNIHFIFVTPGWLQAKGMTTSYAIGMDDLTPAGFPVAAGLTAPLDNSTVSVSVSNIGSSGPVAGSFLKIAARTQSNP